MRNYLIHTRDGNRILTEKEIIDNALKQEAAGVQPVYKWTDYKGNFFPAGWLVWSTYQDGAGVVYRREADGKPVIITGWQAEFTV